MKTAATAPVAALSLMCFATVYYRLQTILCWRECPQFRLEKKSPASSFRCCSIREMNSPLVCRSAWTPVVCPQLHITHSSHHDSKDIAEDLRVLLPTGNQTFGPDPILGNNQTHVAQRDASLRCQQRTNALPCEVRVRRRLMVTTHLGVIDKWVRLQAEPVLRFPDAIGRRSLQQKLFAGCWSDPVAILSL